MTYRLAFGLPMLPVLAGCSAGPAAYPSLSVRQAEARGWADPVAAAPVAVVVADPVLDAQIAAATAAMVTSERGFDAADRRATPIVRAARGRPAGSEPWIAAQGALADLDAQRAVAGEPAGTLEELAATRAQTLAPDYPALEAARAAAAALLAREGARIGALQALIAAG